MGPSGMIRHTLYIVIATCTALFSCSQKSDQGDKTRFTKTDSLTESYLLLQDSLLHAWNVMARDENHKLEALHELLQLMLNEPSFNKQEILDLEQRLEQLNRIRFTQKSLGNSHVIDEYDFASNSLITEVISLPKGNADFMNRDETTRLIKRVIKSDQRVSYYRLQYDIIATKYNQFIEENMKWLDDIEKGHGGEKKALFQIAAQ